MIEYQRNFVSIQQSHYIPCNGYKQSAVRTGYEQVLAQRTNDIFAFAARDKGKVISRKDRAIVIEYENGKRKSIELGRRYGKVSELNIAHEVISDLKEGDTFEAGDIISYNPGCFERDLLNPKNVVWKIGLTVKTVMYESDQTIEDASAISRRVAEQLVTRNAKVKTVVVNFDQEIRNLIDVGNKVDYDTVLCIIEDAVTSQSKLFDEESLNTLRMLGNQSPTAKLKGTLEKIEVFYHGDIEDMSPSLRALASASDRELALKNRALMRPIYTGSVDSEYRVEKDPLALDKMAINFYITADVICTVGDKGVFCNQLKTVFSEIMDYKMSTESGEIIDAVFGGKSVDDRIVNSPAIIGTTNTLLKVISKKAVEIYRGKQ